MRLAIFTSHFPGRINTFFARDVRGLIDAGVEVEVFAICPLEPALWRYVPGDLSERVLPRSKVHHSSVAGGLKRSLLWAGAWRQVPTCGSVTMSALQYGPLQVMKSAYVMPQALAWAREHGSRFDHVLAYWGNHTATCAYLFHRAAGRQVPFSIFLHAGTDLYRTRVHLLQKLRYADNIFVVCEFNRGFLKSAYPSAFSELAPRIHLHHLGIDLEALRYRPADRPPHRLLAVGGLHRSKGFDDLLRAAAEVTRQGRQVEVVIVGNGPERRSLEQLAQDLGIRSAVRFAGWQMPDAALEEMRHATLLVHPSIGLGDAVPTVIKEAMALGTPVVASAVAGIPELLDDGRCGALTPPRNPAALARILADLIDTPHRREAYAAAARQRAEQLFSQRRNSAALAERLRQTRHRVVVAHPTSDLARSLER